MDVTQSFRLTGQTDIEEIPCDCVDGDNIIYWEDIEQIYPGVKHVKNGSTAVKLLRNSEQNRIVPHRIKHYPGVILDVVLSDGNGPGTNSRTIGHTIASTEDMNTESLRPTHLFADTSDSNDKLCTFSSVSTPLLPFQSSKVKTDSKATLSLKQIMKLAQKPIESDVEQRLVISLPPDVQAQVRASTNVHDTLVQAIKGGLVDPSGEQLVACLQELKDKMNENSELASRIMDMITGNDKMTARNNKLTSENNELANENMELAARVVKLQEAFGIKQEEMKQLQTLSLDRLALLQNSVNILMNQIYELHENPIPRLFILLPQDSSPRSLDHLTNNFRLYFLCECEEHTTSTNSGVSHHIHLAKHEGYDIDRPTEFFQQYGPYILTILRMLKFRISVLGIAIPAPSQLVRTEFADQATAGLQALADIIEPGLDQVMGYLEEHTGDIKTLGRGDLQQLKTFLKNRGENKTLGNLYRTVTTKGHVKWVCIDHYRENFHEKVANEFRDVVDVLQGSFDEHIGRAEVTLLSRVQAEQFYYALERAKCVYELKIELQWHTTLSDFKRLRDTLSKTNVSVLEFDPVYHQGPFSDILNRSQRYNPILDIMRHPSIQSFAITRPPADFFKRTNLLSRIDHFPQLRHLEIDLNTWTSFHGLRSLVAKAPHLSSLSLVESGMRLLQVYNAIAEFQTYPIIFKNQSLCIPPPPKETHQSMAPHQYMAHLLKHLGEKFDTLELNGDENYEAIIDTLDKATEKGSTLKVLEVGIDRPSDTLIINIASIVARSELRTLVVTIREDAAVRILESIQWEHLQRLMIYVRRTHLLIGVMKTLVDGVKNIPVRVGLETFELQSQSDSTIYDPLPMPWNEYLPSLLSSIPLKKLQLGVTMTPEHLLSVLKSVDFSRMQDLCLYTKGYDSAKVDALLDSVQHATVLRFIGLWDTNITDEQTERMGKKRISLSRGWWLVF
ncbi:hypothetical protein BGX34_002481 [Mortierella sp. NVP85]|nr:hypothetical protein BGX34_002481 [Mortierella sp. NVP85]